MNRPLLSGFINVYKEPGWTSMDVCARLRRVLRVRRVGHAGTLDPMAEGVLPVALGRATKDINLLLDKPKTYRAGMLLGRATDTEDITGVIISEAMLDPAIGEASVRDAILGIRGTYDQLTPMYSARKVGGKPLYKYARAGIDVERSYKTVTIYDITIDHIDLPHVVFTATVSGGTYIRTLISDIGARLGTGACMESLTRLSVGDFRSDEALRLKEIESLIHDGHIGSALSILSPTAISIGKFDGAHLGHRALFGELRSLAREEGLKSVVIILRSDTDTLLPDDERTRRIYDEGIDYVIELKFDEALKNTSAIDFLDFLKKRYNMRAIVAGEDIGLGKNREGNAGFILSRAAELGIKVRLIEKIRVDDLRGKASGSAAREDFTASGSAAHSDGTASGSAAHSDGTASGSAARESFTASGAAMCENEEISSSLLREMLGEGRMEAAAVLLGESYSLSGEIVRGRRIGTEILGIPTLNLRIPPRLTLPPCGVYAARYRIYEKEGGKLLYTGDGIANLGHAPTVSLDPADHGHAPTMSLDPADRGHAPTVSGTSADQPGDLRLELHAFSGIPECYGMYLTAELIEYIRHEERFDDTDKLKETILTRDIPAVRKILMTM